MSGKEEKDCCKDPHCDDSECLSPEERLKKLYTIPAEIASQLPAEGLKRLEAVIEIQKEHDDEYKNLMDEVRAIQLRYEEKFVQLYKQRQAIVTGEVDPAGSDTSKGISEFWFHVLKNSNLPIEEYDLEPLRSLTNVEYELLPENKGYKISFYFAPNDFFSNSVLTKTFHIDGFMSQGEEDVYLIDGTEIDWKAGKNVTVKLIEKKVGGGGGRGGGRGGKGKRGGKRGGGGGGAPAKTVLVEEEVPSFFRFFDPVADIEKIDPNEDQEAYIMTLQQYQQDQYLGSNLKDKIIPQAPLYYNGVVMSDDEEDDEDFYGGSDEDEDDEEDERALAAAFQSARSQAGGKKRGGGGGGRGGSSAAPAAGVKPEGGLQFSFAAPAAGAAGGEAGAAAPFKFSFNPPAASGSGSAVPAAAASGEAAPFKFSFSAPPK